MSKVSFRAIVLVMLSASCGGGGDDGGTNPTGTVARVEVSAPSSTIQVGQTMQVSVRYFDASSSQLTGRTVSYSSSSSAIATVSASGLVTAAAPGPVTITATVDGVQGNLVITVAQVPVFFIAITPTSPSVRQGESLTLTAQPQNAIGVPITGRNVVWSSANSGIATITQGGVVTGVVPGSVYIRAATDDRVDSVSLRVRSLVTPSITGRSLEVLQPGSSGNITGVNFGATLADNAVLINGVSAILTAASPTSVTFTVPSRTLLPCTATGPAQVELIANGDTARTTMSLRVATDRSLQPGQSLLLTAEVDLVCNEYTGGGKYLITAFNYAPHAGVRTSFRLVGASSPTATNVVAPAAPMAVAPRRVVPDDRASKHLRAHASFMNRERDFAKQLGNPRVQQRLRSERGPRALAAVVPPPAVGDVRTYRMRRTIFSQTTYDEVTFKVVYSGTKLVILEDMASPRAGQMDAEYVKLGEEFDRVMFDQLLVFGDPLVVDSALDNNGRMLALFSPRVNNYTINGQNNVILGFVTLCDFFPRTAITLPDNTVVPPCPSSNEGEAFYALIPDESAGWSISLWRRLMRGTLIHEAKHVASYAWRYFFDASQLEESWLEEATAQQASEVWARHMYGRGARQDLGWADGPNCDYAPVGGACPDPAEGILHHFGFLYDHYAALESKSILDDPTSGTPDPVVYGSSWSFMRYVTDAFATSEPSFLSAIVKVQNDRGVENIAAKIGKPFSELFGMFSLASTADNYPGATITDPKLRLASWNSRNLFESMSANITSGGTQAYPLTWPLRVRQVSFGNFSAAQSEVSLRGGGFAAWELSGTLSGPQALAIRSVSGGLAPPLIGMTILRIQ